MMIYLKISCWLILIGLSIKPEVYSQTAYRLSGEIRDHNDRMPLIGTTILVVDENRGTVSDNLGKYSLTLKSGGHILRISYVGYETIIDTIIIDSDIIRNYYVNASLLQAGEVVITTRNVRENVEGASTSIVELNKKEMEILPSLMGEADVLRLIQLSPGIQSANEGNAGFYVRGGGVDQNLVLLDNAPVYNTSHVLGFFSVFNSDIVGRVRFIKSGMSAEYGGRMSSVVDITTEDADYSQFNTSGTIGLISSKMAVGVPLIKNKVSVMLAGRRSYIDQTLKPLGRALLKQESSFLDHSRYYFYDLNGKISAKISSKDILSISVYSGQDDYNLDMYKLNYDNNLTWGNRVVSANYNRILNDNWYIQNTLGYSKYKYQFSAEQYGVNLGMLSSAEDMNYKLSIHKLAEEYKHLVFGLEYHRYYFVPNNINAELHELDLDFGPDRNLHAHEIALFYNQGLKISNRISANAGLRLSGYIHVGPFSEYSRNSLDEISDTIYYEKNKVIKPYGNIEPRLNLRYQLSGNSSLKAAYTRHVQYIHLASVSSITLPTDVWLPSTNKIRPQESNHITLGYYLNLDQNRYTTSVEVYYKDMENQAELLNGILNNFQDKLFEESMVYGRGRSYGMELYLRKYQGKYTGWIGYTLSRTERHFDEINEGRIYPAKYDRTHDISVVQSYQMDEKWQFSATFVYATGNTMTVPEYKYIIGGSVITGYSEVNSFRMPAYHRLDLSVTYQLRKHKKFESQLNLSVFNVYNRSNPYFIYFEITGNIYEYNLKIVPNQVTLFPIIPSLSWSFKF